MRGPIGRWRMAALGSSAGVMLATGQLIAQTAGATAAGRAPICRSSPNPEYGLSAAQPIQVGGGPTHGSARQRRFLDVLTGPKGQPVRYSSNVTTTSGPDGTLVDAYEVIYDGLAQPVSIYLDWYHYTEHFAPQGFRCGRAPNLGTPPPDPFMGEEQLQALAAGIAAAPGFRAGPIELALDPVEGLVIDRFRVQSRRARPGTAPATGEVPGTIVVAYPQACGEATASATAIVLVGAPGQTTDPTALHTDRKAVQGLVPGVDIPLGSVAATFTVDALQNRLGVRVSFPRAACSGDKAERTPTLVYSRARLLDSPMPARPADDVSDVGWVAVQAVIDHQGQFQQAVALGGPPPLVRAALAAVTSWHAEPARANGEPVAAPVLVLVTFGSAP